MSGEFRALPDRPSLRYLKLEAKRRLAVGEFRTLHDAQVAIAWEYGVPSWAALKQVICDGPGLAHLRWVIARFRNADEPGWSAPDEREMRQHFADHVLDAVLPDQLIAQLVPLAGALRGEPVGTHQTPVFSRIRLAGLDVVARVEAHTPHKLLGLQTLFLGGQITDARAAGPSTRTLGAIPDEMPELAEGAFGELGLAGLVLAGGGPGTGTWVLARGWADLDRGEMLRPGHRFPVPGVSTLVMVTAVLRLVAEGRVGLDTSANDHLHAVRLADGTVTVRELLTHTSPVTDLTVGADAILADTLPDLADVVGEVLGCTGERGALTPNNCGIAVLGQVVADVTGLPYAQAVTRLVLAPLRMRDSSFPMRVAEIGPGAVTGYGVAPEGTFTALPTRICTLPAVAGLWSTGADLVRLGVGWSSLLPETLVREALTPQTVPAAGGARAGLGWLFPRDPDIAMHSGTLPGATASVFARVRDNQVHVTLTSRQILTDPINEHVLRSWTNPAH